jgi:hypothetical protein
MYTLVTEFLNGQTDRLLEVAGRHVLASMGVLAVAGGLFVLAVH